MSNLNLHPLFRRSIGFDRLNDFIDYAMQSDTPNYPPYNIEKSGENRYRIVVATAGFSLGGIRTESRKSAFLPFQVNLRGCSERNN